MSKYKANPQPIENNTQPGESTIFHGDRESADFLPALFQTDINKRNLESTLDRVLSSGTLESFNMYWGVKQSRTAITHAYNKPKGLLRDLNQLSVSISSSTVDASYLDSLRYNGFTDENKNTNGVMSETGYTLDLPINLDMFNNFRNYYWMPDLAPVCLLNATSNNPIHIPDIVALSKWTSPVTWNGRNITLQNGMRIKFEGNVTGNARYPKDFVYIVEGVGSERIKLIPHINDKGRVLFSTTQSYSPKFDSEWDNINEPWDTIPWDYKFTKNILPDYVVQDRSSIDQNPWARSNQWVSIYALTEIARYLDVTVDDIVGENKFIAPAEYPIIEYKPNIELHHSAFQSVGAVDIVLSDVDPLNEIVGQNDYPGIAEGTRILFLNSGSYSNDIYVASGLQSYDFNERSIVLTQVVDSNDLQYRDGIHVVSYLSDFAGQNMHWNGTQWVVSLEKDKRAQEPSFELYTADGMSLADTQRFPNSSFKGDPIWRYVTTDDSSTYDVNLNMSPVLNSSIPHDYKFEFTLSSNNYEFSFAGELNRQISKYLYYKDIKTDELHNGWSELSAGQDSRVTQRREVNEDDSLRFNMHTFQENNSFLIMQNEQNFKVYKKTLSGWIAQGGINPSITLVRNVDYKIELGNGNYSIQFVDPYGNHVSGVDFDNPTGTLRILNAYPYESLWYRDVDNHDITGHIAVHTGSDYSDIRVLRNGARMEPEKDFLLAGKEIIVTRPVQIGDILEVSYPSVTNDSREMPEQAPLYAYNPLNSEFSVVSFSEISKHFKYQFEGMIGFTGRAFGTNNYHNSLRLHNTAGTIRQQAYSPAKHALLAANGTSIVRALEATNADYVQFYTRFNSKVTQLWNTAQWADTRSLVDAALKAVFVGKTKDSKYALSNMAYPSDEVVSYTMTDAPINRFRIPGQDVVIDGAGLHVYAWVKDYLATGSTKTWRPLTSSDYEINNGFLTITGNIEYNNDSVSLEITRTTKFAQSFIPFSAVKLGLITPTQVEFANDCVVCHDGTRVNTKPNATIYDLHSVDFDVVAAATFELESRISANLNDDLANNAASLIPKYQSSLLNNDWETFVSLLAERYREWKLNNSAINEYPLFDSSDEFTYNYEWLVPGASSWKSLYLYMFGTTRPHTHPWEMLGLTVKPANWDNMYDWVDPFKRDALLKLLRSGNGDPTWAHTFYRWGFFNFDPDVLVTLQGELNGPVKAGIAADYQLADIAATKQFLTFEGHEESWVQSRSFAFDLMQAVARTKPYQFTELFWKIDDYRSVSNNKVLFNQLLDKTGSRSEVGYDSTSWYKSPLTAGAVTTARIIDAQPGYTGLSTIVATESIDPAILDLIIDDGEIVGVNILSSGSGYYEDFDIELDNGTIIELTVEQNVLHRSLGLSAIIVEHFDNVNNVFDSVTANLRLLLNGFTSCNLLDVSIDNHYQYGRKKFSESDYSLVLAKSMPIDYMRYSAVQVTKVAGGFEISGFDTVNPNFEVAPVIENNNHNLLTVQGSQIKRYNDFLVTNQIVPYGRNIQRRQDLFNFITGVFFAYTKRYGFDHNDWQSQATKLMNWSLDASTGDAFVYTGFDDVISIDQPVFGYIRSLEESKVRYSDSDVSNLDSQFAVTRSKDTVAVEFNKKPGLIVFEQFDREHCVVLDNTVENAIVYSPELGLRQSKILVQGDRTRNWNGRLDANGYMVTGDSITPTFETNTREIERDINTLDSKLVNPVKRDAAMFNRGYVTPQFMVNGTVTENAFYHFDQGMSKYKGTSLALEAFLSNQELFGDQTLVDSNVTEMWMAHLGQYGDYDLYNLIEVEIDPALVTSSPQTIRFNDEFVTDFKNDLVIDIYRKNSNVVNGNFTDPFKMLDVLKSSNTSYANLDIEETAMPTAGLPLVHEADYKIKSIDDLPDVYNENEIYASIPQWQSNVSYKQDDLVRLDGGVYRLKIPVTGFSTSIIPIEIRGTNTSRVTPSGSSLLIDGVDIDLTKSISTELFDPIEITGTVSDPSVFNMQTLTVDGVTVVFEKTEEIDEFENIVFDGTVQDATISGTAGKQLIIESQVIDFEELVDANVENDVTLVMLLDDVFRNTTNAQDNRIDYINLFNTLREEYVAATSQADWNTWISAYFSGQAEQDIVGFNISYLQDELTDNPDESYSTALDNFTQFNIAVRSEYADIEEMLADFVSGTYSGSYLDDFAPYVTSGVEIDDRYVFGTETVTVQEPRIWNLQEIVDKINNANITNVSASTFNSRLRLGKTVTPTDNTLVIGNASANTEVGFPTNGTTVNADSETITIGASLTPSEAVDQFNSASIAAVTAFVNSSNQIVLRSTNEDITFGSGSAASVLGLPLGGTINATSSILVTEQNLDVFDIVDIINSYNINNVISEVVDGNIIITSTNPQLTIGPASANSVIGIRAQTISASEIVRNVFDSNDWTLIDDPALFRIWLLDNKGVANSITSPAGWNVYQTQEFDLSIIEVCVGIEADDEALIKTDIPHNLQVGDYVLLLGTSSEPNLDGFHRVTRIPGGLGSTHFYVDEFVEEKGFTGKVLPAKSARFQNVNDLHDSATSDLYNWRNNDVAYVTSNENDVEAAYRFIRTGTTEPDHFELLREREPRADNKSIGLVSVYNGNEGRNVKEFQIYDPAKGLLPGAAEQEIDNIGNRDPAGYNATTDDETTLNNSSPWAQTTVGTVWWDTTDAVYYDYEQSTVEYRQAHWGKLFPTSDIDVYEWTASPVPPSEYDDAVEAGRMYAGTELTGTPKKRVSVTEEEFYNWTEILKYDITQDRDVTVYYFWVKNKNTVPVDSRRNLSVQVIARIIKDPISAGFDWAAVSSRNSVLVSNIDRYLQDSGSVLQVKPVSKQSLHREYTLVGDSKDQVIPEWLHMRMRDSLAQYNSAEIEYKFSTWNETTMYDAEAVVEYNGEYYLSLRENKDSIPTGGNWRLLPDATQITNRTERDLDKISVPAPKSVPNMRLHRFNRFGNETQNRQGWIKDIDAARRVFVERVNSDLRDVNLVDTVANWRHLVDDFDYTRLWSFVDFSIDGADWNSKQITVASIDDLNSVDNGIQLVGVEFADSKYATGTRRQVLQRAGTEWLTVFKERATIELSQLFWNYDQRGFGWDAAPFGTTPWDADPGKNLGQMFDVLRNEFYVGVNRPKYTSLWFALAEYVVSEHHSMHWLIKSSLVRLSATVEKTEADTGGFYQKSLDNDVESYVNYVKPFHTKLDDFLVESRISERPFSTFDRATDLSIDEDVTFEITTIYNDVDVVGWQANYLTGGQFDSKTNNSDSSNFNTVVEYSYTGGKFVDPINEGWGTELHAVRILESVEISVQTNESGSVEDSNTRSFTVMSDFYNQSKGFVLADSGVTLSATVDRNQTTIPLTSVAGLTDPNNKVGVNKGRVKIGRELIEYAGIHGNNLVGCVRGELAQFHFSGTRVYDITLTALPTNQYHHQYTINAPLFSTLSRPILNASNTAPGAMRLRALPNGTLD